MRLFGPNLIFLSLIMRLFGPNLIFLSLIIALANIVIIKKRRLFKRSIAVASAAHLPASYRLTSKLQ